MLINPYVFSKLWTPAQITTSLWLDAADSSTITTVSGAVSQWNDKSGNNRNAAQATAASRPAYVSNLLNALPGVTFDGSNDWLESTSATLLPSAATDYTMLVVCSMTTRQYGSVFMHTTSNRNFGLQQNNANVLVYCGNDNNTYIACPRGTAVGIDCAVYQASASPRLTYRLNGSNVSGSSTGTVPASLTPATGIYVLGRTIANYELNCSLFELIVCPSNSSPSNYQMLEGYLAWKWGLTANLPAGHPYKSAAPTV